MWLKFFSNTKKLKNSNKKIKNVTKTNNEVQKKTKQNRKKTKSVLHADKHRMCIQKIRKSKYTQKVKQSYRILEYTVFCSGQVKCC